MISSFRNIARRGFAATSRASFLPSNTTSSLERSFALYKGATASSMTTPASSRLAALAQNSAAFQMHALKPAQGQIAIGVLLAPFGVMIAICVVCQKLGIWQSGPVQWFESEVIEKKICKKLSSSYGGDRARAKYAEAKAEAEGKA